MEKRSICIVLILATMATLLVGCGSSKELPPPAKPANEAEAEALIAQSSADEHKIFPDLTIDELCELSLNEMRQLEFRGILDTLTEAEQEQYLSAIKEKQTDRDKIRAQHSDLYTEFDKNMLWPLNDSIESWTFVDCITGKIYSFPVIGLDEIIDSINMERFVPDVYGKGSDIPSGRAGCPSPITDELWYDPWTKSEYKYPIDIYLARLEMGALSVLFNQGRLQPLGSYEKYSARPIEEVSNVQKTEDELYGPYKSPFTDDSDYARYYTQYYAIKKNGKTIAMVDCLTGMTYQVSTDANGDLNKLYYDVIPGERERLGLTELYEGNCLYPVYSEWRGVFYDTWTKAEYTKPIEMYLARKEAGLLPEILGEDIYNSLDQSKMY